MLFQEIYNTGLTRIIGGRGIIEKSLNKLFLKNLLPYREKWAFYGRKYLAKDPEQTERALLRYTLNHLLQLLEDEDEECFREEVYLYPPMSEKFMTGSIVKTADQWFVVLSPACDLVIDKDNDECSIYSILDVRADYILLVEIDSVGDALEGSTDINKIRSIVYNKGQYRHWLPPTEFFEGGVINFSSLKALHKNEFNRQFEKPLIQISPFFLKDIVSRFSSYYARQGQPDIIDREEAVDIYLQQQNEEQ